jgi:antitoxin ParD1/3/4
MPSSVSLGAKLESVVDDLVKSGRYGSRSEVMREGVRLVHDREAKLAVLDAAIARGIADADAGRVVTVEQALESVRTRDQSPA